jgi:hypothetical protein
MAGGKSEVRACFKPMLLIENARKKFAKIRAAIEAFSRNN